MQIFAQPVISSFTPASGPVGTSVTISGTGFSTTPANNIVLFGAVRAAVSAATATSLTVTVPAGATYQPITVAINSRIAYSDKPFMVTFSGGGTILSSSFATPIDFATDYHPNDIVMADFDGDGKSDLATANNYSVNGSPASVSILKNTSSPKAISFAPASNIPTGVQTYAIATGDLDGDGKPDLVSSSITDQTISVFKNTSTPGTISFAPKINYPAGDNTYSIVVADLDQDGKPDLAVASYLSNSISIYKNTNTGGTISFGSKIDLATGLAPNSIDVADLDADGKVDLAVTNNLSNTISVFRNTSSPGAIAFAAKTDVSTGYDNPYGLAIGDLDGDEKADLVVTNNVTTAAYESGIAFSIFRNTSIAGAISFAPRIIASSGDAYNPSLGDLNGDAKTDIVILNSNSRISIYENKSTPGNIVIAAPVNFYSLSPYSAALGDLDGDGMPDIAAANFTTEWVSVLRNKITEPAITSFSPTTAAAGQTVTITGTNLGGVTGVRFGGVAAASFTILSSTTITAVVGAGASGDVTLTTPQETLALSGFSFAPPPAIASFSPASAGSGASITINGIDLTGATAVSFGGVAATSFTVLSPTTILAVVGGGATGNVSITTPGGTTHLAGFIFLPPPVISSFTPSSGIEGTVVTITGSNFTGATAVSFGGTPATSFTVVSTTTIMATVGTGASGQVSVTGPDGTGTLVGFNFIAPSISSFSPASAKAGSTIIISGNNFLGTTAVSFGGTPASSFTVISPTTVSAIVDTGSTGAVSVTTPYGTTTKSGFTFIYPPTLSSFTPASGNAGTMITLTGTNLTGATSVSFGGAEATSFTVNSSTSVTAIVGSSGSGNVQITAPGGITTLPGFSFLPTPAISSFSPASGTSETTVVITGTNFSSVPADNTVYFGAVKAAVLTATSSSLTVKVPVGATTQFITVTTNNLTAYSSKKFMVLPLGNQEIGSGSFVSQQSISTGSWPANITAADLDNDGKTDLITANDFEYTVAVLRNTTSGGAISFASKIEFNKDYWRYGISIATSDINGDGKLDLIVFDGQSAKILLYKNTSTVGNVSFAFISEISIGSSSRCLSTGDLDADGKPDIVAGSANGVSVLRNISTAGGFSFAPKIDYVTGTYPHSISVSDLNGDNKPELTVANFRDNTVSVLQNTSIPGVISFHSKINYATGTNPYMVSTEDLDGDGKLDIIVANENSNTLSIFRNTSLNENVSLSPKIDHPAGPNPFYIAAADLDGDGKLDLAVGNEGASFVSVFKNTSANGTISLAPKIDYPIGTNANSIVIADLDGDGKQEIASTNLGSFTISILKNQIITALDPVENSAAGLRFYPNPTSGSFTMDTLKLSDKWETLEIWDAGGNQKLVNFSIKNQTRLSINIDYLPNGLYMALLKRKNGRTALVKFVKL